MESDLRQRRHLLHPHRPPPPTTAGLTRFRSAPSSFFESLLESCEEFLNRPSSPETERMLTRLISDDDIAGEFPAPDGLNSNQLSQYTKSIKTETETLQTKGGSNNNSYGGGGGGDGGGGGGGGGCASQNYYRNSSHPPPMPNRNIGNGGSSLIRQSSSPAGLFSDINIENGSYGAGMGGSNGAVVTAAFRPPTNLFSSPMNFSSSSSGMASSMVQMMSPIAETGQMRIIASELLVQDNNSTTTVTTESSFSQPQQQDDFTADFSWDDAQSYCPSLKRARHCEDQSSNFSRSNSSEIQNDEEFGRAPSKLAHHLSLPNTSAVDKFLQLQDTTTVPWRIRAKRGCATHPRSIAERVRRTRISERMRKLQDLVPNMDKTTNTSEMLDFAVEHIKDLQKQLKMLSASRASCRCQQ